MDKIELIISIREVRGTHERCVYYARLPAVERRGRVAIYGRRISKRWYQRLFSCSHSWHPVFDVDGSSDARLVSQHIVVDKSLYSELFSNI